MTIGSKARWSGCAASSQLPWTAIAWPATFYHVSCVDFPPAGISLCQYAVSSLYCSSTVVIKCEWTWWGWGGRADVAYDWLSRCSLFLASKIEDFKMSSEQILLYGVSPLTINQSSQNVWITHDSWTWMCRCVLYQHGSGKGLEQHGWQAMGTLKWLPLLVEALHSKLWGTS